jgi:mediator of RNA polymerase II transcription subunit 10
MVQVHAYDAAGKPTEGVLISQSYALSPPSLIPSLKLTSSLSNALEHSIQKLAASTDRNSPKVTLPDVPPELIRYVDGGRNPDIYTREFVELARRSNQLMKGKETAFGSFRDILAQEMVKGMPEVRGDVKRVDEETGGRGDVIDGR